MSTDKNFLQTIKLEISRNFKLLPYERLVFHRILGILKSDAGYSILTSELDRGKEVRSSAISVLVKFETPGLLEMLLPYLSGDINEIDRINILKMFLRAGSIDNLPELFRYIESTKGNPVNRSILSSAFDAVSKIGRGNDDSLSFLLDVINSGDYSADHIFFAIRSLSAFRAVSVYENILSRNEDGPALAVYNSISFLLADLADEVSMSSSEEEHLFTYNPENEDKMVLNLRVLLGKNSSHFESYSNRTKAAYIASMMSSNHREYLIYVMKALTSGDYDLIRQTLYTLHTFIERLRDPDKLFRSLIALSTETVRDNRIIVGIFKKYFSLQIESRQFFLMRDKMYSYIVVTMDTYFEMFRKEFMISDVAEKGYPENFQRVRKFILNNLTPDLKKKIIQFLTGEESTMVNHIIKDIGGWFKFVDDKSSGDLSLLMEILFEKDKKTREISASRIEDIRFEKRYLKNRIIRLCKIISELGIDDASSSLVNIYNYLKKYPEDDLMDEIILTLSNLNYSYMLGEIEVQLNTGSDSDKKNALDLIALFTEQRSLNILMEFIHASVADENPLLARAVDILLKRDISGNMTAAQILKAIIEKNTYSEAAPLAVLGIGMCGMDSDLAYLNDLFIKTESSVLKEGVVRAMGSIISDNPAVNRKMAIRYLQEYLRDPGIRVRIYSCLLLVKLGDKDAVRSIRDMLIIKNKGIQRDILTILGDLKSIEFAFFLLSLLKEEYGISRDIVNVLSLLPLEDMKEIDGFIVNIFRKYEAVAVEGFDHVTDVNRSVEVTGLVERPRSIMRIEFSRMDSSPLNIPRMIDLNMMIKDIISQPILSSDGVIAGISNRRIIAVFESPLKACEASLEISELVRLYNRVRARGMGIITSIKIITGPVKTMQDELIVYPGYFAEDTRGLQIHDRAVLDKGSYDIAGSKFSLFKVSNAVFGGSSDIYEMISPINFTAEADAIYKAIVAEDEKREQKQHLIETEMKRLRREVRSPSSMAVARELDNIGYSLKEQLDEIDRYIQRRANNDRELIKNVKKMLDNAYNLYKVEVSRIMIE